MRLLTNIYEQETDCVPVNYTNLLFSFRIVNGAQSQTILLVSVDCKTTQWTATRETYYRFMSSNPSSISLRLFSMEVGNRHRALDIPPGSLVYAVVVLRCISTKPVPDPFKSLPTAPNQTPVMLLPKVNNSPTD